MTTQVVTIGGAYAVKSGVLSPLLLTVGAVLSFCFILMFNRDRQIRDAHSKLMRELAESIEREIGDDILSKFNVNVPPSGWAPVEAGKIFRIALGIVVILEFLLALLLVIQPEYLSQL